MDRPWACYQDKLNEPIIALRVDTIKPAESRVVYTEAGVNSSEVKRGTKVRLDEVFEMVKST